MDINILYELLIITAVVTIVYTTAVYLAHKSANNMMDRYYKKH
jgi:hypothetical protein